LTHDLDQRRHRTAANGNAWHSTKKVDFLGVAGIVLIVLSVALIVLLLMG